MSLSLVLRFDPQMDGGRILTHVEVQGFKALRNTAVRLAPFTVIVGGNASGKSSLLDAVAFLESAAATPSMPPRAPSSLMHAALSGIERVVGELFSFGSDETVLQVVGVLGPPEPLRVEELGAMASSVRCGVRLELTEEGTALSSCIAEEGVAAGAAPGWVPWSSPQAEIRDVRARQREAGLGPVVQLRLDARVLAYPSLVSVGEAELGNDGSNLAAVLHDVRDREDGSFAKIVDALRGVVPIIGQLRVRKVDWVNPQGQVAPAFGIEARIGDGADDWCPAHALSEGTLMVLAVLTAMYASQEPRMLLLDDIDRGLHPRAQSKLVGLMRGILEQNPALQILCTTHSPYTVDAFELDEVVVLQSNGGTNASASRLRDHPEADKWRGLMEAGEFWTSVGDEWVFGP